MAKENSIFLDLRGNQINLLSDYSKLRGFLFCNYCPIANTCRPSSFVQVSILLYWYRKGFLKLFQKSTLQFPQSELVHFLKLVFSHVFMLFIVPWAKHHFCLILLKWFTDLCVGDCMGSVKFLPEYNGLNIHVIVFL